jgi:hypothetical protein
MARDATEAEVLAYLRNEHPELSDLAVWTRSAVLAADPDLTERVYRGWRGVGFRHPEAGYICAIYPRSEWIVLLFEHGAALPDPDGVLLGDGKQTRFFRIGEPSEEVAQRITAYVQQAVAQRLLG